MCQQIVCGYSGVQNILLTLLVVKRGDAVVHCSNLAYAVLHLGIPYTHRPGRRVFQT